MKLLKLFLLSCTLLTSVSANAGEIIYVQVPAIYEEDAYVREKAKEQCAMDQKIGQFTLASMRRYKVDGQGVNSPEQAGNEHLLKLTILGVRAVGGGPWTGPKSIRLRADLSKGGVPIASKLLSRSGRGGMFTFSTCGMLDAVSKKLGGDVAVWLKRGAGGGTIESGAEEAEEIPAAEDAAAEVEAEQK